MAYAAVGLVLSLVVHVFSFFGPPPGGEALFFALHVGIFPLWIPVVFISMKLTSGIQSRNSWKAWNATLSGCPDWLKYMTYGFFIYAIVNFVIFAVIAPTGKPHGDAPPDIVWKGFSGHWMLFYCAGLATLTTAYRRGLGNLQPKCPNGHAIAYGDKFCSVCGIQTDRPGTVQ
jgi:hypothetical protein